MEFYATHLNSTQHGGKITDEHGATHLGYRVDFRGFHGIPQRLVIIGETLVMLTDDFRARSIE